MSTSSFAKDPAINPFLNALLREWSGWQFVDGTTEMRLLDPGDGVLHIDLPRSDVVVLIRVARRSTVGYNDFAPPFYLRSGLGESAPVDIATVIALLLREPSIAGRATEKSRLTFLRRVLASTAASREVEVKRSNYRPFAERDPSFIEAESALRFGHAIHPAPMSREEFTQADSMRYGHEYGESFALRWWAADPELLAGASVAGETAELMSAKLAAGDDAIAERAGGVPGKTLLPLHPWQALHLMQEDRIERLLRSGRLVDLGTGGPEWRATSSLRTIHSAEADWMLKFSLSLRLTNSKRIIEERECRRGLSVHRLVKGALGDELRKRCPSLRILGEPAWLALRDADGAVMTDTIVSFRENPFRGEGAAASAVLGALCERHPGSTESHLSDLVTRIAKVENRPTAEVATDWFSRFLDRVVEPFLVAFGDFGLLFGAHQQNLVLGLRDGWPETTFFRDCQGTGYIREFLPALRRHLADAGQSGDHVFRADEAAKLFGYYLIVNGVFATVGALAAARLCTEAELLDIYRKFLDGQSARGFVDRSCIDYLRSAPEILAKGNFLIALRNINENTEVTDPLAGYVGLPNPLHAKEYA